MDLFKCKDKYGKKVRCPNTYGGNGTQFIQFESIS